MASEKKFTPEIMQKLNERDSKEISIADIQSLQLPVNKQKVILIDMDDTITNTTLFCREEYRGKLSNILLYPNKSPSKDFFIEGSLEFIKNMKQSGVKVGLVSHAYVGFVPIVERALEKRE